jgi:hypothetical protein
MEAKQLLLDVGYGGKNDHKLARGGSIKILHSVFYNPLALREAP